MTSFTIDVYENGIVLGGVLGIESKVYETSRLVEALLEIYHRCDPTWTVGDRVIIQKVKKEN